MTSKRKKSANAGTSESETSGTLATRDEPSDVSYRTVPLHVRTLRESGGRVVFTNGCFDLLHRGHVTYLEAARSLGDVLVVGLNSDASVVRLKGPSRPVVPEEDRAAVLDALGAVDTVILFDEDTPVRLLRELRPAVYVKGGDYRVEDLPEAKVAAEIEAEVRILPFEPGYSTTALIEKIRNMPRRRPAASDTHR